MRMNQMLAPRQHAAMAPGLQQSLHLLQLSSQEIRDVILAEHDQNPLLEVTWRDAYPIRTMENGAFDRLALAQAPPDNLERHLVSQARISGVQGGLLRIVSFVAGNLDDNGYLAIDPAEVRDRLQVKGEEVAAALKLIRSMEPPGVGARDLQECLLLQLAREEAEEGLASRIVRDCLEELSRGNLKRIGKKLQVSEDEVQAAVDRIRRLDPRPGLAYADPQLTWVRPDAYVVPDPAGDGYGIVMDGACIPSVEISVEYARALKRECDEATVRYVRERLLAARWLIRSLRYRNRTLCKVISCVVERQRDFLETGPEGLKPLKLKDVAELLDMSESTISRAVRNKYVSTPQGTFELKRFFSGGLPAGGSKVASSRRVKARIEQLICQEDKKNPLSDQEITRLLIEEGIRISRRTVMKYREQMNLLSSRYRVSM